MIYKIHDTYIDLEKVNSITQATYGNMSVYIDVNFQIGQPLKIIFPLLDDEIYWDKKQWNVKLTDGTILKGTEKSFLGYTISSNKFNLFAVYRVQKIVDELIDNWNRSKTKRKKKILPPLPQGVIACAPLLG